MKVSRPRLRIWVLNAIVPPSRTLICVWPLAVDVEPVGRQAFGFPALTYWPKRTSARMAYLTLFPIGAAMRANLMVYRDMTDPWLSRFRQAPEETMRAMMPG